MTLPEGAALGTTEDPKALVKGEPAHVDAAASRLSEEATRIKGIGSQFAAVRIPSWDGGLGQPAYAAQHAAEVKKWTAYGELLTLAGGALRTYAGALRTAQSRAQDAIDRWREGEEATAAAVASYNAAVKAYNDSLNQCVTVPSYGGSGGQVPRMGPAHPGVFVDPGEALRQQAEQILEDARTALDEAGAAAVKELGGLEGARTETSSGPGASGSVEGPSFSWNGWEQTFGNSADDPTGKGGDPAGESPWELSLGSAEGEAHAWGAEGEWEDHVAGGTVKADGSVVVLGVEGNAQATVNADGLNVGAGVKGTIAGAEGSAAAEFGYAEVGAEASAYAGGEASGEVLVDRTGAHASGELFAGGKVEGSLSGDVGGVGGEVTAEGWAGIGASFEADYGFEDGKLTIGASGGAAVLLGGKVGGSVSVDFNEVKDTAGDIVDSIGGLLD